MSSFADFKRCCNIELGLEIEALDVLLFDPLQDCADWYTKQNQKMRKLFVGLLSGAAVGSLAEALAKFLATALQKSAAEAGKISLALIRAAAIAAGVGIALAVFLEVVMACAVR